jgi:hypothetical protein
VLEKNYGIKVDELCIISLHPDNDEYLKFDLPLIQDDVRELLEHNHPSKKRKLELEQTQEKPTEPEKVQEKEVKISKKNTKSVKKTKQKTSSSNTKIEDFFTNKCLI